VGELDGKVALVTGGSRGIGAAICAELAAAGATVAVNYVRNAEAAERVCAEISAAGGTAHAVAGDVSSGEAAKALVAGVEESIGPVEILVNNAGWDEMRPFLESEEPFWDRVIDVNYKGCLRMTRATLPDMVDRGWGRIVNIGSDAGRVGSSFESVYSGAKGAIIAFTKTIAREVARTGVTANTVCPGPTDTPMLAEVARGQGEKIIDAMTRAVPMKRLGTPEDIANAVAFFASDESSFITGQTLSVSGGLTMA
jgi:2-hydroxycyclohexanecarboxyl-CoA dehydrogenase